MRTAPPLVQNITRLTKARKRHARYCGANKKVNENATHLLLEKRIFRTDDFHTGVLRTSLCSGRTRTATTNQKPTRNDNGKKSEPKTTGQYARNGTHPVAVKTHSNQAQHIHLEQKTYLLVQAILVGSLRNSMLQSSMFMGGWFSVVISRTYLSSFQFRYSENCRSMISQICVKAPFPFSTLPSAWAIMSA